MYELRSKKESIKSFDKEKLACVKDYEIYGFDFDYDDEFFKRACLRFDYNKHGLEFSVFVYSDFETIHEIIKLMIDLLVLNVKMSLHITVTIFIT